MQNFDTQSHTHNQSKSFNEQPPTQPQLIQSATGTMRIPWESYGNSMGKGRTGQDRTGRDKYLPLYTSLGPKFYFHTSTTKILSFSYWNLNLTDDFATWEQGEDDGAIKSSVGAFFSSFSALQAMRFQRCSFQNPPQTSKLEKKKAPARKLGWNRMF